MIGTAIERHGTLDVLVNNAGILDRFLPPDETPDELWERVLRINLTGPFLATKRAISRCSRAGASSSSTSLPWAGSGEVPRSGLHLLQAWPYRADQEHRGQLRRRGHTLRRHLSRRGEHAHQPGRAQRARIRHLEPHPPGHGAPGRPHRDSRSGTLLRFGGGHLPQRCGDRG